MSDDNSADDRELTVNHDREIVLKESLTVKSKRGTGTNDRDEVRRFVEMEADLDVPEGMLDQIPALIGEQKRARTVSETVEAMAQVRESNNGDE